jgi:DNA cross-link repair 1A protein
MEELPKRGTSGTIYCSVAMEEPNNQQLGIDRKWLHPPHAADSPVVIESRGKSVTVTLLDANHCPGAVMFCSRLVVTRVRSLYSSR